MIKMIVADYDDTTAKGEVVSDRVKQAIKKFRAGGGKYVVCSGRESVSIENVIKNNGIIVDAISSYQGGRIRIGEELFSDNGIPSTLAAEIVDSVMEDFNRPSLAFFGDFIYYNGLNDCARAYLNWTPCDRKYVKNLGEMLKGSAGSCGKILVTKTSVEEDVTEIKGYIEQKFGKYVSAFPMIHILELVSKIATKYDAVKRLAEHFGIKENEVITIGDSPNDGPLLKFGTGIMVTGGSGENVLEKIAEYKAPSVEALPVAVVLESIIDGTFPNGLEKLKG